MKLHELRPSQGGSKKAKRRGRGISSGLGKTSGRGHKGQKARSKVRIGFEGGQMPLYRRIPKRGFTNIFRKEYAIVNIKDLERFENGTEVTPEIMEEAGLLKTAKDKVKILGDGEITKELTVKANKFSKTAEERIIASGGKVEVI